MFKILGFIFFWVSVVFSLMKLTLTYGCPECPVVEHDHSEETNILSQECEKLRQDIVEKDSKIVELEKLVKHRESCQPNHEYNAEGLCTPIEGVDTF